jgi:dTDP-glucose 4,6-dehydratase
VKHGFADACVVVFGGAGFIGSHLCERLLCEGASVIAVDSFLTSEPGNVEHLTREPGFRIVEADVTQTGSLPFERGASVDFVVHLASPASPLDYLRYPDHALRAGSLGTFGAVALAREHDARLLFASTSEVYGDPEVHPQPEWYAGRVDPVGIRAVYDEAKRFGEAVVSNATRSASVNGTIARIFNTVGPRMRPDDGRMVPAFVECCRAGEPMTIFGDGRQTRSVADVNDTVEGLLRLLRSDHPGPINIGNPDEHTVIEIAGWVAEALDVAPEMTFGSGMEGDPAIRCPDISLARSVLGWEPGVTAYDAVVRASRWLSTKWSVPA